MSATIQEPIWDSIAGNRKLSLNHWRYRLLHWCFGIAAPTLENGKLPRYLYTHYCPLFHLTNLIAIFSPVILVVKIVCAFFGLVRSAFIWMAGAVDRCRSKPTAEEIQERERQKEVRALYDIMRMHPDEPFGVIWVIIRGQMPMTGEDEARKLFQEAKVKIEASRKVWEQRRDAFRTRILFWVNFSRVFIKAALALAYLAAIAIFIYLTFSFGASAFAFICRWVGEFVSALFTVYALIFLVWMLTAAGLGIGIFFAALKMGPMLKEPAKNHLGPAIVPVTAIDEAGSDLRRFIWRSFENARAFISVFYEENCPKIEIVSDVEAARASAEDDLRS